jgi:hypothetical protein
LPSRVSRGTGHPQCLQNHLPKRFAVGRSYWVIASSPESHRN